MRHCADCNTQDGLVYDVTQPCQCKAANGMPLAETNHDPLLHQPDCYRLRHLVTPYRKRLRRYREVDSKPDEMGVIKLPADYAYERRNGFTGRVHSGFLWSEKYLCKPCVIRWEQRQSLRKDYEAKCAALKTDERKPHEYESAICF